MSSPSAVTAFSYIIELSFRSFSILVISLMCSFPPQPKRQKVKNPNRLLVPRWSVCSEGKSQPAALPQVLPTAHGWLPWGRLTLSRARTISLTLFYFLLARGCWKSSSYWMVTVPTTHTLGRAWLPLATSMTMVSQVGAISFWAVSGNASETGGTAGLLPWLGAVWHPLLLPDPTGTWACAKDKHACVGFVC